MSLHASSLVVYKCRYITRVECRHSLQLVSSFCCPKRSKRSTLPFICCIWSSKLDSGIQGIWNQARCACAAWTISTEKARKESFMIISYCVQCKQTLIILIKFCSPCVCVLYSSTTEPTQQVKNWSSISAPHRMPLRTIFV